MFQLNQPTHSGQSNMTKSPAIKVIRRFFGNTPFPGTRLWQIAHMLDTVLSTVLLMCTVFLEKPSPVLLEKILTIFRFSIKIVRAAASPLMFLNVQNLVNMRQRMLSLSISFSNSTGHCILSFLNHEDFNMGTHLQILSLQCSAYFQQDWHSRLLSEPVSRETGCYWKGESRKSWTQKIIQVVFPKDLVIDIIYNDFCKDNVSWRITSK